MIPDDVLRAPHGSGKPRASGDDPAALALGRPTGGKPRASGDDPREMVYQRSDEK